MLFFAGFSLFFTATIAFILAILSPNWISFTPDKDNINGSIQRGIFYICDVIQNSSSYKISTQCTTILTAGSSPEPNKWKYEYGIAISSLSIACASLSIICVWLCCFYSFLRRKSDVTCFLVLLSILFLLNFCLSFIVWILMIVETNQLGLQLNRNMFGWPMWLAIGSSGGYFLSFLSLLFYFCVTRRQKHHLHHGGYGASYQPRNQF